jgi:H+/Cl- antiporter ClcA
MINFEPLTFWRLVLIGLFSILVGMRLYFRHRFRRMWRPPRPREEGLLGFLLHGALVIFLWVITLLVMFRPGWIT